MGLFRVRVRALGWNEFEFEANLNLIFENYPSLREASIVKSIHR